MRELIEALRRALASPAFKFLLTVFLILVLTIPLLLVYALVWERESRAQAVHREVGRQWGPEQQLTGPFLIVPYTVRIVTVQGDKRFEQTQERRAVFTPERLEVTGRAEVKTLQRAIFEVPVYTARLELSGRFASPSIGDVSTADIASVRWRDATFVLAVSGVSGLKEAAVVKIAGIADIPFAPSLGIPEAGHLNGIHAKLGSAVVPDPDRPLQAFAFTVDLVFNGSVALKVAPVARSTHMSLASDWPHPSFDGAFLPDERKITAAGFTASWKVPHLARSVPEAWTLEHQTGLQVLQPYAFGVRMISPVDFYSLVMRALKYGIQFLALAFMAVFCMELTSRQRVHPVQYLFTGIAMVFFYVLLLSLTEHVGFAAAYLTAALATGLMLAVYVGAAFRSARKGLLMLLVLAAIYGILYLILQLEDYALLAGAILGFLALTTVMFVTLRVDWSGSGAGARPAPQPA